MAAADDKMAAANDMQQQQDETKSMQPGTKDSQEAYMREGNYLSRPGNTEEGKMQNLEKMSQKWNERMRIKRMEQSVLTEISVLRKQSKQELILQEQKIWLRTCKTGI